MKHRPITPDAAYTISEAARFLKTSYGRLAYAVFRTESRPGGSPFIQYTKTARGPTFTRAQLLAFAKRRRLRHPKRSKSRRRRAQSKKFAGLAVWV